MTADPKESHSETPAVAPEKPLRRFRIPISDLENSDNDLDCPVFALDDGRFVMDEDAGGSKIGVVVESIDAKTAWVDFDGPPKMPIIGRARPFKAPTKSARERMAEAAAELQAQRQQALEKFAADLHQFCLARGYRLSAAPEFLRQADGTFAVGASLVILEVDPDSTSGAEGA